LAPCRDPVVERVLAEQRDDGSFGAPLETAFAVSTLLDLAWSGPALGRARRSLLATQEADGSWPASAFFLDFEGGFYGSREVSTALALEALVRLDRQPPG
ncbi:MAG TPA: hypothetical protein VF100_10235, partial [Thermoanaerobaculia bacterium]